MLWVCESSALPRPSSCLADRTAGNEIAFSEKAGPSCCKSEAKAVACLDSLIPIEGKVYIEQLPRAYLDTLD